MAKAKTTRQSKATAKPQSPAREKSKPEQTRNAVERAEAWLDAHWDTVAIAIIGAGFLLRLRNASLAYLNGDEALHFLISFQNNLAEVFRVSLYNAHPPLLYFVIWFWRHLGNSEWMLRLPMVLAGTGFVWFIYRWAGIAVGKRTALVAAGLLSVSPTVIGIVTELRHYALALLFASAALYSLEVAFQRQSMRWIAIYFGCFTLAIFSHYSTVWFAIAVGVYALLRIARRDVAWKIAGAWAATQVIAGGFYLLLYEVHIRKISGGEMQRAAVTDWLRYSYFQNDQSLWTFFKNRTESVFTYQFASETLGHLGLLLFLAGIGWLVVARKPSWRLSRRWPVAILLITPVLAAFTGSVLQLTPYGGTRHTSFLLPYVMVAVSVAIAGLIAAVSGRRILPLLALIALAGIFWPICADPKTYDVVMPYQKKEGWRDAAAYIRANAPAGSILFTDYQTCLQLGYYLGRDQPAQNTSKHGFLLEYSYGGYRVISITNWTLQRDRFQQSLLDMGKAIGLPPGTPVWTVTAGPSSGMYYQLASQYTGLRSVPHATFADSITVFRAPPAEEHWW